MDVFSLRKGIIDDYSNYVGSFINIKDPRIMEKVNIEMKDGLLWPEPLLQLNPSFMPGASINDLTAQGILHEMCSKVFCIKGSDTFKELHLHKHQEDAIRAAASGESYVLTTGTGSGKSLAYIIPIVNHVLKTGSNDRKIKAIIIYPMNALANSQAKELEKFLKTGFPEGQSPLRFASFTGQEKEEQRQAIKENPPDILLTNYVMMELLLTRPYDKHIIEAAEGLKFLVLDELHTYRGRQGADVALLVRRIRDRVKNPDLQCIGTSATLAGGGSFEEQQDQVAAVASRIFGTTVKPERVIGETLRRVTPDFNLAEEYTISMAEKTQDDIDTLEKSKNRHTLRLEFWKKLLSSMNKKETLFQNISPSKDNWISSGSGIGGVTYNFAITHLYCRTEIMIQRANAAENKMIFDELFKQKDHIEERFGGVLEWEKLDNKKASRIKYELKEVNLFNTDDWEKMISFLVDGMVRMEKAFKEPLHKVSMKLKSKEL
ncbi:MAG: DUF4268 domain-containing protein [Vulcanimicrobiota bacterium]